MIFAKPDARSSKESEQLGTNTYLISDTRSVLIDTGEGEEDYLPHLRSALKDRPPVSDVIITHWHHDHVLGLSDVLTLLSELQKDAPPRVWKQDSAGPDHDASIAEQLKDSPGRFVPASSSKGEHHLDEGHEFEIGKYVLRVVSTPGHTDDSISLVLRHKSDEEPPIIFTADTVLGQGTAVFEDLAQYLASLKKLVDLTPSDTPTALYPGHGPVIEDGRPRMEHYISHRLERENQVVEALKKSSGEAMTPEQCVSSESVEPRLLTLTVIASQTSESHLPS